MRKPSFFERLTGAVPVDEYDDLFEDEVEARAPQTERAPQEQRRNFQPAQYQSQQHSLQEDDEEWAEEVEEVAEEGELAVDVYQTPDAIIVRALVAGVSPANLDISLTRDMITIKGSREEHREVNEEDYFYKELSWGTFSRTILLPAEVEVDEAEANEKHGILVMTLPKINKERETKLKVKSR